MIADVPASRNTPLAGCAEKHVVALQGDISHEKPRRPDDKG